MTKRELLKPRVLDSVTRLRKFVELDAPIPIIGHELANLFRTALATYGSSAGLPLLAGIAEHALQGRGLCILDGCTDRVDRSMPLCETHQKEFGVDEESIRVELKEAGIPVRE